MTALQHCLPIATSLRGLRAWGVALFLGIFGGWHSNLSAASRAPNILVLVAGQWRAQAFGIEGDPNARTPHFDQLARESVRLVNAVSALPVCSPTRASLLTSAHCSALDDCFAELRRTLKETGLADDAAVIFCVSPFGEWERRVGGKEYRGLRTPTHTYVRDLQGPWLLFDNVADPYQTNNLIARSDSRAVKEAFDQLLLRKLEEQRDAFESGKAYLDRWNYRVNAFGTMPFAP